MRALLLLSVMLPLTAATIGWRGDTSGNVPDATPPLSWSATDKLAWKAALPAWSAATPLVIGDKVIVLSDPNIIDCLDLKTGSLLWRGTITEEQIGDQAAYAEIKDGMAKRHALWEQIKILKAERKGKQGDEAKVLGEKIAALDKERLQYPGGSKKPGHGVGYTCATPISDGEQVFVFLHSGLGACFALSGQPLWTAFIRPVNQGYGQSMSPALVDGVIGLHVDEKFIGIDFATGKILWEGREVQHQGSPVGIDVDGIGVFLGTDGTVFDARTGAVVTKFGFPALNKFNTPVVQGTQASWISEGRFLVTASFTRQGDQVTATKRHVGLESGIFYASALLLDDKAYCVDATKKNKSLRVLDLANKGKEIARLPLKLKGMAYPSPTAAGGLVFVGCDSGQIQVFAPGTESIETGPGQTTSRYKLTPVRINEIGEKLWASPVFVGDRLLLRGKSSLYCVQADALDHAERGKLLAPVAAKAADADAEDDLLDDL